MGSVFVALRHFGGVTLLDTLNVTTVSVGIRTTRHVTFVPGLINIKFFADNNGNTRRTNGRLDISIACSKPARPDISNRMRLVGGFIGRNCGTVVISTISPSNLYPTLGHTVRHNIEILA